MFKNIQKLISNFFNSLNGLRLSLKEHSFISEIIFGILLIPILIIFENDNFMRLLIIVTYFILLAFELINTSIEKISDKINKNYDPDIKQIKDISSAAVFIVFLILFLLIIISIINFNELF